MNMAWKRHRMCRILCLAVVCEISAVLCAPRKCAGGTYFDKHTGRRECCSDLCENVIITGLQQECNNNCPDYGPKPPRLQLGNDDDSAKAHIVIPTSIVAILIVIVGGTILALLIIRNSQVRRKLCVFFVQRPNDNANNADDGAMLQDAGMGNVQVEEMRVQLEGAGQALEGENLIEPLLGRDRENELRQQQENHQVPPPQYGNQRQHDPNQDQGQPQQQQENQPQQETQQQGENQPPQNQQQHQHDNQPLQNQHQQVLRLKVPVQASLQEHNGYDTSVHQ